MPGGGGCSDVSQHLVLMRVLLLLLMSVLSLLLALPALPAPSCCCSERLLEGQAAEMGFKLCLQSAKKEPVGSVRLLERAGAAAATQASGEASEWRTIYISKNENR